jgi:uncharacterized membrane protein
MGEDAEKGMVWKLLQLTVSLCAGLGNRQAMNWLTPATEISIVFLNGLALLMVVAGSVEAIVGVVRLLASGRHRAERRDVWLRYARWLVAALTFQLGADIVESSITHEWQAVARLGAVAVIRTFLNYFLDRDMVELRERHADE